MLKLVLVMAVWASHSATAALPDEPIQPIPLTLNQDPARADIGRLLFRDTRLSGNGRVSCASCHDLGKGGGDGLARSRGLNGGLTDVNTPTVLNAALNFRQFWNGRADSLEAQVDHLIQNPVEMGSNWKEVVRKVSQDVRTRRVGQGGGCPSGRPPLCHGLRGHAHAPGLGRRGDGRAALAHRPAGADRDLHGLLRPRLGGRAGAAGRAGPASRKALA